MDAEKNKGSSRLAGRLTTQETSKSEGNLPFRSVIAAEAIITPDFPLNQFAIRHSPLPSLILFQSTFFVPRHNKWRRRRAEIIKSLRRRREGEANLNKRYVTIPISCVHAKEKDERRQEWRLAFVADLFLAWEHLEYP